MADIGRRNYVWKGNAMKPEEAQHRLDMCSNVRRRKRHAELQRRRARKDPHA